MDESDRLKAEQAEYLNSLEGLVKGRTDQLQQEVRKNWELLECLRQIQSMQSVGEVREAAQACIRKFDPEPAPPSQFGGKPGEMVPEVDPEDVKATWVKAKEAQARHPGGKVAMGLEVIQSVLKPGANVQATWYRCGLISMLSHIAPQQLAPWMNNGEPADAVFRVMASIPLEWMGVGVVRQSLPFDAGDFFRRLSEQ